MYERFVQLEFESRTNGLLVREITHQTNIIRCIFLRGENEKLVDNTVFPRSYMSKVNHLTLDSFERFYYATC